MQLSVAFGGFYWRVQPACDSIEKMRAERERLLEERRKEKHWRRWGPYLTERAWGNPREDYSAVRNRLGLFHARSCSLARLSLDRGRHRRHLRQSPAPVFRVRLLERTRSDSEGAPLRAGRPGRQSRRGRQGILLLPGLHSHALLHEVPVQISAVGVSVRAIGGSQSAALAARSPNMS